eukprot:TRINITY_DN95061_c0_g1_i1.p1 TRINITY_DN95061_c0_g1~~TRINITY_DN95061_c0_g1_i1.p1  ORF type:complete len:143 (+),score=31.67 TRINITY_DN95061_c0_g1_i1:292-720(+)
MPGGRATTALCCEAVITQHSPSFATLLPSLCSAFLLKKTLSPALTEGAAELDALLIRLRGGKPRPQLLDQRGKPSCNLRAKPVAPMPATPATLASSSAASEITASLSSGSSSAAASSTPCSLVNCNKSLVHHSCSLLSFCTS